MENIRLDVPVSARCAKCGGMPTVEIEADDSPVTCSGCGAQMGTMGELREKQRAVAIEAIKQTANNKGFKVS